MVGVHAHVFAHDIQIGVLQPGEGLLAAVLARGGRAHGHGNVLKPGLFADVEVGAAHLGLDILGQGHREDGRLYEHGTLAQLVDALGAGGEAFNDVVDEGTQLDQSAALLGFADDTGNVLDELLQVLGVLVDLFIVPLDLRILGIDRGADEGGVDLGLIEQLVEGDGRNGAELGRADAFDLADDGGVVVFAADENLGLLADGDDCRRRSRP